MSRLKNYATALGSSYLALAANIVYTLLSLPLALRYLSKSEFALWGLTAQMAGYVALIDLGMAGASRILIDHKDRKDEPTYGSVIQTTLLVSVVQGLLIVTCGIVLAFGLAPLLRVPQSLNREFMFLVIGQCGLLAGTFVTRLFNFLLAAHQRQDVQNYTSALGFAVSLGVLWGSFRFGAGVFSTIWAQVCAWLVTTMIAAYWCIRLRLFPNAGCWGRPRWDQFLVLFAYGRDIFLVVAGGQLINASHIILVTRQLGLEAAAIWVICTRSYLVVVQLISRIFDSSCPALAEMVVRQDTSRLRNRFRSVVVVSASGSVLAGTLFAACNQSFVAIWTNGKASWPIANDMLLAITLVLFAISRCHVGLTGQTKELGLMRYVWFAEGLWLVGWSLIFLRTSGIPGMLLVGIAGTFLFSLPYGTWRTAKHFSLRWKEVAIGWLWPTLRMAVMLVPLAAAACWLTRSLPALTQLVLNGIIIVVAGSWLLLRHGLESDLRTELSHRLPAGLRALMPRLQQASNSRIEP